MQSLPWSELVATKPTDAVQKSIERIEPKTIGKFLFTSGSTGMPKAVINTQEMMCANLAMGQMARVRKPTDPVPVHARLAAVEPHDGRQRDLPGQSRRGRHDLDRRRQAAARPVRGDARNLREISPTYFANVPAGYAMLATALEKDELLAQKFFKNLNSLAYGGATLSSDLYERMERLAVKHTGYRLPFITGWGSTETAPTATTVHWASERVGLVGLPFPGVQLKMVPTGEEGRYELRLEERDRDAGLLQAARPHGADVRRRGLLPDRRCRPLRRSRTIRARAWCSTAAWSRTSSSRAAPSCWSAPCARRRSPPSRRCCRTPWYAARIATMSACWASPTSPPAGAWRATRTCSSRPSEVLAHPAVVETVKRGLAKMNAEGKGSSMKVKRVLLMAEPPSVDGHEITDKGYINQRATLERRKALVDRLYAGGERRDRDRLTEEFAMAGNGQTVIDLDKKRMQAMATKDVATLESLIADDLIYTHSSARLDTKRSLIDNMTSGSTVYTAVEPSDVKAQDLGDTVVLTGIAQIKVTANGNAACLRRALHRRLCQARRAAGRW